MKLYLPAAALVFAGAFAGAGLSSAAAEPAGPSQPTLAEAGRKHFIRCVACHTTSATARQSTGPHLEGIVGRKAAALPDFAYTDALKGKDFIWDEARLDAFLKDPRTAHPGMCLTFHGLPKAEDRVALIAYLRSLTP